MRWLRVSVVVATLVGATREVGNLVLDPLVGWWHLVTAGPGAGAPPTDPAAGIAVVTGLSAALLLVAWAWLLAAVGACVWDVLRGGASCGGGRVPSALRPRLVRAVVATVLGAGALTAPTTHAQPVGALPDDLVGVPSAAEIAGGLELLEGLPAPDRVPGTGPRSVGPPATAADGRRTLRVRPGDSLWTLTAGLLPADAPMGTVARGWRLLYAANRAVVGSDPDLLHPGQSLHAGEALLHLVRSAHRSSDTTLTTPRSP